MSSPCLGHAPSPLAGEVKHRPRRCMVTVDSLRADDPQEGWAGDPGSQVGVTWPPQAPEPPGREQRGLTGRVGARGAGRLLQRESRAAQRGGGDPWPPRVPHSTREPPARSPSLLAYLPQTPGPRPQAVGVPLPGDQVDKPSSPKVAGGPYVHSQAPHHYVPALPLRASPTGGPGKDRACGAAWHSGAPLPLQPAPDSPRPFYLPPCRAPYPLPSKRKVS